EDVSISAGSGWPGSRCGQAADAALVRRARPVRGGLAPAGQGAAIPRRCAALPHPRGEALLSAAAPIRRGRPGPADGWARLYGVRPTAAPRFAAPAAKPVADR